jgi:hypothetical protein
MLREAFPSKTPTASATVGEGLYLYLPLKERSHLEVVTRGVDVLLKRLLRVTCLIAPLVFEEVS